MLCQVLSIPIVVGTLFMIVTIREKRLIAKGQPAPGTPTSADHPQGGTLRQGLRANGLEVIFTLLFLIYPLVAGTIFKSFLCIDLHDGPEAESLMFVDFELECGTDGHALLLAFSTLMVLAFPLGIPASLFAIVFYFRKELKDPKSPLRVQYAPICGMMKPTHWYHSYQSISIGL
jgi:hypothetical protein